MTAAPLDPRGLEPGYPFKADLELTPRDLKARLGSPDAPAVLDVRTAEEFQTARIAGSIHIPLHELEQRIDELEDLRGRSIAVMCHHGVRSMKATLFLRHFGFDARSIAGGIELYSRAADASIPRYDRSSGRCVVLPAISPTA